MKSYSKVKLAGTTPVTKMRNNHYGPVWSLFPWRGKLWIWGHRTGMIYQYHEEEWKVLKEEVIEIPS